jgi:hypothetical protein
LKPSDLVLVRPQLAEEAKKFGFLEDGLQTLTKCCQTVDQGIYSAYGENPQVNLQI